MVSCCCCCCCCSARILSVRR